MITLEQIRKRLIDCIKTSGLSQSELGRRLEVRQSAIAQYLSGRAMPALDTLANLCQVLDVSSDYILCLEDAGGVRTEAPAAPAGKVREMPQPEEKTYRAVARSEGNKLRNITLTESQIRQIMSQFKDNDTEKK